MPRIAYVNGRYLPLNQASVNIEDRGYQFADGVYEVCEVRNGRLVDEARHYDRLRRSLAALEIAFPMATVALGAILREVVWRNRIRDGLLYLQVTRGVAPRNHAFPDPGVPPAVVVTGRHLVRQALNRRMDEGIAVITLPENRWPRVDIKSVSLLPNVLAKQAALRAGAFEAWFVDTVGRVTEGSSSNAWIVTAGNELITAPGDQGILRGVTRHAVLDCAHSEGLRVDERRFTPAEAYAAREAFITSATTAVTPVIRIDDRTIGDGRPGAMAKKLRMLFFELSKLSSLYARPE